MNPVAEITLSALERFGSLPLPDYARSLELATLSFPPPFGEAWYGDRYRQYAVDPVWLANSLIANARKEAEGSLTLWSLAGAISDSAVAIQVKQHALDEARHSRIYIALLEQVFEGWDITTSNMLRQISPRFEGDPPQVAPRTDEVIYDEIIQMNIGEIRTMIHQLLLRPVLWEWCPQSHRSTVNRALDSLLHDETRHIDYTARLIQSFAAIDEHREYVFETMKRRVADFNDYTLKEVGPTPE